MMRRTLLVGWLVIILMATTFPWSDFKGHAHWGVVRWLPFSELSRPSPSVLFDIGANIALFVPFGYLAVKAMNSATRSRFIATVLLTLGLSSGIELYQVFSHNHVPSVTDVCSNAFGAAIGAYLAARRLRPSGRADRSVVTGGRYSHPTGS
ncbi:MAG: VanZ family protein [Nitrospirota bacterium]